MFKWRGVVNGTLQLPVAMTDERDVSGALRCSMSLCTHCGSEKSYACTCTCGSYMYMYMYISLLHTVFIFSFTCKFSLEAVHIFF